MGHLQTEPKPISRAWPFKRAFYGWAVVVAAFSVSFGEVPVFGPILGIFIMPMLIYAVMSGWDWRTAFMVLAATTALLIVLPSLTYLRRQPEDYGLLPDGETRGIGGRRGPGACDEVQWSLLEARRTRAFWLIVLFTVCTPFVQGATNLHMVINFQDQGMADGLAVSVLSIFAASSALSMMPVGLLLERMHVRYGAMLQAVVLIVSLLVLLGAHTYWEAVVFAVLFGVAAGMRNIVETLLLANYFGRESLGAIKGFSAPFRIISPIGPLFAGFVRDTTGSYEVAFIMFIGVSFVMLLAMVAANPPVKRGRGPQADAVAVNLSPE